MTARDGMKNRINVEGTASESALISNHLSNQAFIVDLHHGAAISRDSAFGLRVSRTFCLYQTGEASGLVCDVEPAVKIALNSGTNQSPCWQAHIEQLPEKGVHRC